VTLVVVSTEKKADLDLPNDNMATEDSPRSMTTRTAGGSPYLQSFLKPAEEVQGAQFERALQMNRAERENEAFDLAKAKDARMEERQVQQDARQKMMDERTMRLDAWKLQRDQENQERMLSAEERKASYYDLAQRRQDAVDNMKLKDDMLQTKAAELSAQLYSLDPNRPDYRESVKSLISDPENSKILNSKYGKEPLAIQKEQNSIHTNMVEFLETEQKKFGATGSIYDLPKTKNGDWDISPQGQIYGTRGIFTQASKNRQATIEASRAKQEQEAAIARSRGETYTYKDPETGARISAKPEQASQALQVIKQVTQLSGGVPPAMFTMKAGESSDKSGWEFVSPDDKGNYKADPKGQYVRAKWKDKGKSRTAPPMTLDQFAQYKNVVQKYATSLPQTETEATTPTQQPSEGTRVKQNGVTYEYRNGSYIQVD